MTIKNNFNQNIRNEELEKVYIATNPVDSEVIEGPEIEFEQNEDGYITITEAEDYDTITDDIILNISTLSFQVVSLVILALILNSVTKFLLTRKGKTLEKFFFYEAMSFLAISIFSIIGSLYPEVTVFLHYIFIALLSVIPCTIFIREAKKNKKTKED